MEPQATNSNPTELQVFACSVVKVVDSFVLVHIEKPKVIVFPVTNSTKTSKKWIGANVYARPPTFEWAA